MFIIDNIINILFSKQFIQYFSHRFILKMDRYFPGGIDLPQVISKIKITFLLNHRKDILHGGVFHIQRQFHRL